MNVTQASLKKRKGTLKSADNGKLKGKVKSDAKTVNNALDTFTPPNGPRRQFLTDIR